LQGDKCLHSRSSYNILLEVAKSPTLIQLKNHDIRGRKLNWSNFDADICELLMQQVELQLIQQFSTQIPISRSVMVSY
jgi:hypothetical protein